METMTMQFPQSLTQKYCPKRLSDLIGLEKPRKILAKLAANPRPMALTFVGPPGVGKTSAAFCFAAEIGAEVHHIGSAECSVDRLRELVRCCQFVPLTGGFHVVIADEFDSSSEQARAYLLSKLDSSELVPNTIFVFTCNSLEKLDSRFLSRTMQLEFNSYGASNEIADLLARVWNAEVPGVPLPSLKKIICGNVRESLVRLEMEILAA